MKNIDEILLSILVAAYKLGNKNTEENKLKFLAIIEKWTLGREKLDYDNIASKINESSIEECKKIIIDSAYILKEKMSVEGLSILYNDIKDVFMVSNVMSDKEQEILSLLEKEWEDKGLIKENLAISFFNENKYKPQNKLFALGIIFYSAIKIDGNIDNQELIQVRRNLELWDNKSARLILEAINFAEFYNSNGQIANLFKTNQTGISEAEKEILMKSIKYLKENERQNIRKIMYDQILTIIKADSKIHEKERWLCNQIKKIWTDI